MPISSQDNDHRKSPSPLRSALMVLGLLIVMVFILVIIFSIQASAESGAPPINGTTDGDWIIEGGDDIIRTDETLTIGGDIIIEEGGYLTFVNTSLFFTEKGDSEYYEISMEWNGFLILLNGSEIDSESGWELDAFNGGRTYIENSILNNTRMYLNGNTWILNSKLTNLTYFWKRGNIFELLDSHVHFRDVEDEELTGFHQPEQFFIWSPRSLFIENNTIITNRSTVVIETSGGMIANNTFTHPRWVYSGLGVQDSSDITIINNLVELNGKLGITAQFYSYNITIKKNTLRPLGNGDGLEFGIYVRRSSSEIAIDENTIINANRSISIAEDSNSCTIRDNIIEDSIYGIRNFNGTHSCEIKKNSFRNVEWAIFQSNNVPIDQDQNVFINVNNRTGRENGFVFNVRDKKNKPIEACNVTITNRFDDVVFQGQTMVDGFIPWIVLHNMTQTQEGTTYYAPYTVSIEKWGKTNSESFDLPESNVVVMGLKLDIKFDASIDLEPIIDDILRGEQAPIALTIENSGTMAFSHCDVVVEVTGGNDTIEIFNETFQDLDVSYKQPINTNWFVDRDVNVGTYFAQCRVECHSQYLEEPHVESSSLAFHVINLPPTIDPELHSDPSLTVGKNEIMVINLTSYISDYEDDPNNLTLGISDFHHFKEVEISMMGKTISITPLDQFHGLVDVNITIMDLDGSIFSIPVLLRWTNHKPVFNQDIQLKRYSIHKLYQLDLSHLASDEDINDTLSWNFTAEDHDSGNISIVHNDDHLIISREQDNVTSADLTLTVHDTSDANASRVFTIIWESNVFLSNLEIPQYHEYSMQNDTFDILVSIHNVDELNVLYDLFFYLDSMESPVEQLVREIEGGTTEQITIPWSAVGGNHEIIISLVVSSPQDRNLTDHILQLPITVYFPMTMICNRSSDIPLELMEEGNSLQVEVFTPPAKGIDHVTILIENFSYNGVITEFGGETPGLGEGGESLLIDGIRIAVSPQERNINSASSGQFIINITINDYTNFSNGDVIGFCIYAEGDDGRSNDVVLHVTVQVESEKSTSQIPFFKQTTVILIISLFLLPLVAVKASSALSNSFYSMYKLTRMIFLLNPKFYAFLCPLATKYFEDDETRYNEYRDEICKFLEARGEQGATIHEVMKYLKKWLPYGTTGDANPEDQRVTGVVREHINVLRKKKFIRVLGGRYYFRSYQPALPQDVYSTKINWKSLLRDDKFRLKGETICHLISMFYNNGNNGMKNKELAQLMDMTPYALHYHIRKLENMGVVEKRKGQGKRYFLNTQSIQAYIST